MAQLPDWGEYKKKPLSVGPEEAYRKAARYCAYQERCHAEVRELLYGYGLHKPEVEELIAKLISENYLHEERYALQFAGGHFRMKQWGRIKIRYHLRKKGISEYCIRKALASLDESDYLKTLHTLAVKRYASHRKERIPLARYIKTKQYLLSRGFEADLTEEVLKSIVQGDSA